MTRVLATLLLLLLIIASPRTAPAGIPGECCLCAGCITGPSTCLAPGADCEAVCIDQLGCPGFTTGMGGQCSAPTCAGLPTTSAPTASHLGLAVIAGGLMLIGVTRIARRRPAAL